MGCCGPIPWDSVDRFAHTQGFNHTQIEYDVFCYLISHLDNIFLDIQRSDAERASKTRSNKPTASARRPSRRGR